MHNLGLGSSRYPLYTWFSNESSLTDSGGICSCEWGVQRQRIKIQSMCVAYIISSLSNSYLYYYLHMLHNMKELWVVCSSPYAWNTYVVFEILDCIHYYPGKSKNECNTNKTLILGSVRDKQYPQHGIWSGTQIHALCLFTNKFIIKSFISHLLPDSIWSQYWCSLYLSHGINPFFMVLLELSRSTFLSISG